VPFLVFTKGRLRGPRNPELVFIHRLKLRPPQLAAKWIDRPSLESRLRGDSRVIAVSAGPGYGKTMLAARAVSEWLGPSLWYSLDAADSDLAVFAAHLDAGLRALGTTFRPLDLDNAATLGSPREVGTRFAEILADLASPPLVAFDDVHAVEGSRSLEALAEFVERGTRAGAKFILCGRALPLSLHRFAAAGGLETIGPADLAFGDAEARKYLSLVADSAVEDDTVARLAARAEGWPAGLALIAQSASAIRLSGYGVEGGGDDAHRYLFEYLAREVLDGLSDDVRRFLLETSALDRLETQACNAIAASDRSAEILESLVDRGLFVSRRSSDAFSVHQLFKEFLQEELVRTYPPDAVAALHRRIAEFYETHGDPVPVIDHLLLAGDIETAATHLERAAFSLLRAGVIGAVTRLMGRVGQARIAKSPTLMAVRGRLERERGDWDVALITLERAIVLAREARQFDVLAETVRITAPILASRNQLERLEAMLHEALSADARLPESSATSLRMTLAAVQLEGDRFDEALAMYREITPKLVARADLAGQGLVLHNVAVAHLRRGELYAGLSTYERALKIKEDAGHRASVLHTLGDIVYVKTIIGDLEEAQLLVERLVAQATDLGMAATVARAHEQRGALALLRDDVDAAAEAYRSAQAACDPGDVRVLPDIEHGLAQCALRRGMVKEAEFLVSRAAAAYRSAGRNQQLAPLLLTQGRCAIASGDNAAAARWTLEAIAAAGLGADALLECVTSLDAADILVGCAAKTSGLHANDWEKSALAAARRGVALVHERDYRFLLRTKTELFARLRPHFKRWGIGATLLPADQSFEIIESLRIEMLGTFRAFVNGRQIGPEAWKRRRAPELLAFLISHSGRPVPRTRLIDLYWPDSEADAAHDNLRVTVTAVRKAVGDVIKYEANAYRFAPPPGTIVDVDQFDENMERARQADAGGNAVIARDQYGSAIDLYRGEYLEGFADAGWQWRERERLRAGCLEALRWLARDREAAGDAPGERLAVERLLEVSPFDLDAVRMRLEALVRERRSDEAERDYAEWRTRYRQTVGAEAPAIWDGPTSAGARVPARLRN
jgi:ATP/maltotriose-dependent transcriptional regulator MalT/DNA-binding SARP family transcriptional activator